MTKIPIALRRLVINRSSDRCEYCKLSQAGQIATFHIDHVIPDSAGGPTSADNLALACVSCSLKKGARQCIQDPETGDHVQIFNPRLQLWSDHFAWEGVQLLGLSVVGRATIHALQLNRPIMVAIRSEEVVFDRHPPT